MAQVPVSPEPTAEEETPERGGSPVLLWIAIAAAAVILAAVVISTIAAPLSGLLAPVEPPVFQPSTLLEHRAEEGSLDEWFYATSATGCEVASWYRERADRCWGGPGVDCSAEGASSQDGAGGGRREIVRCERREPFGSFVAEWEIYVTDGYTGTDGPTHFTIVREIDWMNQQ